MDVRGTEITVTAHGLEEAVDEVLADPLLELPGSHVVVEIDDFLVQAEYVRRCSRA